MDLVNRIKEHYVSNWKSFSEVTFKTGAIIKILPEFRVLKFPPNSGRNFWTYATCGMSEKDMVYGLELFIFAPSENDFMVDLLVSIAYYHASGNNLWLGHTVNFGYPWYENSNCDHGLISLPYLDGPSLEWLEFGSRKIRFLWLIPVTSEEVEYKKKEGLDSLEKLFEEAAFNYIDPYRSSVV